MTDKYDQLSEELHRLIHRHAVEDELSYVEILGILAVVTQDINDQMREALGPR
jgi:hypothetical protein